LGEKHPCPPHLLRFLLEVVVIEVDARSYHIGFARGIVTASYDFSSQ